MKLVVTFVLAVAALCAQPSFDNFAPVFHCSPTASQVKAFPNMACDNMPLFIINDWAIEFPSQALSRGIQGRTLISPDYALTEQSAIELAAILGAQLFHSGPFGYANSGVFSAPMVPWLKFQNGAAANAAFLARYFAVGSKPAVALANVQAELAGIQKLVDAGVEVNTKVVGYPAN